MLMLELEYTLPEFTVQLAVECSHGATAILGPSGAGKTTLLHLIAGLLRPDRGIVRLDDTTLYASAQGLDVPPEKRRIGYVFQDDLLFPHLTVEANLRYGYERLPSTARRFAPEQIIDLLEIGSLLKRRPRQLSGGERQRLALGRALLSSPQLLLMDEPLASLDQGLKSRIIPYLRYVHTELDIPIVYVSHSVAEILELTGQVIVLKRGQVVAQGDFFHIAHHPEVLPLVEEYGFENVLSVELVSSDAKLGISQVHCNGQALKVPYCPRPVGARMFIGVRADDIILARQRLTGLSVRNMLEGHIVEMQEVEGMWLIYVDVGSRLAVKVTAEAVQELNLVLGLRVVCLMKTHSIRLGPEMA